MLNAYGPCKFFRLDEGDVWKHMNAELKTGAQYMTELCDESTERRGIGINRWLQVLDTYMAHQLSEEGKKQNAFVMKEEVYTEFYAELQLYHPSVQFLLAPKKAGLSFVTVSRSSIIGS